MEKPKKISTPSEIFLAGMEAYENKNNEFVYKPEWKPDSCFDAGHRTKIYCKDGEKNWYSCPECNPDDLKYKTKLPFQEIVFISDLNVNLEEQ